tara:strand:+ start:19313 stop:19450 length:138 start_codon:yes stop_codon:yes gene_type:complete
MSILELILTRKKHLIESLNEEQKREAISNMTSYDLMLFKRKYEVQ